MCREEPKLTRHGYNVRTLSEKFNAKPAEIKRLLRGELEAARTRELTDEMLAAGLPLQSGSLARIVSTQPRCRAAITKREHGSA